MFANLIYRTTFPLLKAQISFSGFIRDDAGEIDEKAVLIVVLVLGAMAGVETVTGAISSLLTSAAAGL